MMAAPSVDHLADWKDAMKVDLRVAKSVSLTVCQLEWL